MKFTILSMIAAILCCFAGAACAWAYGATTNLAQSQTAITDSTLIPIGAAVILVSASVGATWKVARFVDKANKAHEITEQHAKRLDEHESRLVRLEAKHA